MSLTELWTAEQESTGQSCKCSRKIRTNQSAQQLAKNEWSTWCQWTNASKAWVFNLNKPNCRALTLPFRNKRVSPWKSRWRHESWQTAHTGDPARSWLWLKCQPTSVSPTSNQQHEHNQTKLLKFGLLHLRDLAVSCRTHVVSPDR